MKTLAVIFALFSHALLACSEAGPKEMKVSQDLIDRAGRKAIQLAYSLSETEYKLDPKKYYANKPPYSKARYNVTETRKGGNGMSPSFNLWTGFTTEDGWECIYCISFEISGGDAHFHRIYKHFCSK